MSNQMGRKQFHILLMTAILGVAGIARAGQTIIFQNGLNGYVGCEDTWLNGVAGEDCLDQNYGGSSSLLIGGVPWSSASGRTPLIRFNNLFGTGANQIPYGSTIVSARFRLTASYRSDNANAYVSVYAMLTDWSAGTACGPPEEGSACQNARRYRSDGNYASHPADTWGNDGLVHSTGPVNPIDWNSGNRIAYCYLNGSGGGDYPMDFDVTSSVRDWGQNPDGNRGFILITSDYWAGATFYPSEAGSAANRPQLVVEYGPAPDSAAMTVAKFRMDQGIGGGEGGGLRVKDISGHGHDLVFNNANFSLKSDNPFNAPHSQSVYRPDANLGEAFGSVSNPETINLNANGARTFTLSGWFKPTVNTAGVGLIHFRSSSGGTTHLILETDATSKIIAATYLPGGSWKTVTSAAPMLLNQWTHVAMVGDADGNISLYVNGTGQGTVSQGPDLPISADTVYVGFATNQSNDFVGYIDDVRICDDAMSFPQIYNDYTHTFTVTRTVYADAAEFGGFDPDNATTALQNALNCDEATKVIVPNKGTPWYVDPIFVGWCDGMDIEFQDGVLIKAREGSFHGVQDMLFKFNNVRNMTLSGYGATFQMRKLDYMNKTLYPTPAEDSEYRHNLGLYGVDNFTVEGLTLKDSGGDGIEIANGWGGFYTAPPSRNVTIRDVVSSNQYRQGMSVISVEGLLVENSVFTGTSGTAPQDGIDIEPSDGTYDRISDITIRNCVFSNNAGYGMQVSLQGLPNPGAVSGIIENCTVWANGESGIYFQQSLPLMTVKDSLLANNTRYGIEQIQSPASTVTYSAFWGNTLGAVSANVIPGTGSLTTVQPLFASTTFGDDDYMYLASTCPVAITTGASDAGFLGAKPKVSAPLIPGDANHDNKVDVSDLGILAANYGGTGKTWELGDFSGDHKVDVSDLGILAANYGTGAGGNLDFHTDASALGLTIDVKEETPVSPTLGCGSVGLPLIAGVLLMGLVWIKLEE